MQLEIVIFGDRNVLRPAQTFIARGGGQRSITRRMPRRHSSDKELLKQLTNHQVILAEVSPRVRKEKEGEGPCSRGSRR